MPLLETWVGCEASADGKGCEISAEGKEDSRLPLLKICVGYDSSADGRNSLLPLLKVYVYEVISEYVSLLTPLGLLG